MNSAAEFIREKIARNGPISFAEFMQLALYAPDCGYYEKCGAPGKRGDFFTSVSVGSLFGKLLAFQFGDWFSARASAERLCLVETGAHHGALAGDILDAFDHDQPAAAPRVEYWIVEPSDARRQRQTEALSAYATRIQWAKSLESVAETFASGRIAGLLFSNELLDAFPVRRLGWDKGAGAWFEWLVNRDGGRFVWERGAIDPKLSKLPGLASLPAGVLAQLPDGYCAEISPAASAWWANAASLLEWGRLMTIDYGFSEADKFRPERQRGTLRGYRHHRAVEDLLQDPGETDLTAHLDFSALKEAGEMAGLKTDGLFSQETFLAGIAKRIWEAGGPKANWSAAQRRQFQTLIHPEHLGRFSVLIQSAP